MSSRIRSSRERRGLTTTELGAAVGVSDRTIVRYEATDYVPKLKTAMRIAKVLEIPVEDLGPAEEVAA